jgi:hypothetical protein
MGISSIPTWGKIAIGVGAVAAGGLLLAACGKPEDPQAKVLNDYQPFDTNRDNQWTKDELVRNTTSRPYTSGRYNQFRIGDYVTFQQNIQHDETTSNMQRAWAGARGNDAIASLQELTNLALTFDTADKNGVKDGMLSSSERNEFERAYGIETHRRTIIDNTETRTVYDPVDNYPSGGNHGGTSSGDDSGVGGNHGGTSSGDDGGYTPPSGGTSSGDTGGTPPSSGGSSNSGNSTDNGNPSDDDF